MAMTVKVLFVSPPRWHEMLYPAIGALGKMVKLPPIGLLYMASTLRRDCDCDVAFFDFNLYDETAPDYGVVDGFVDDFRPDVVAITSYTFTVYDVYEVAKRIKALAPQAKIVLGGKHCQIYPHETLSHPFVDYLVQGDGEAPFAALINAFAAKQYDPKIQGVWYKNADGSIHDGGAAATPKNLDVLPLPAIDLIDRSREAQYGYSFGTGRLEGTMYTSRGCPWKCSYCMSAYSDHRYYYHSPENVVAGVEQCVEHGYGLIHFFDDHWNLNIKRAKDICRLLIERDYGVKWTMRGSAKFIDAELAELLEASGCERLNLGVESAHEGILESFNRFTSVDQIRGAYEMLDGRGIALASYFILGWPDEDRAMAQETIELAKSLPLDFAQFTPLTLAPGTPFLHDYLKKGLVARDTFRDYTLSPTPVFKFPYIEGKLKETEVAQLLEDAYRQFYLRPSLVWRHVKKLRSVRELFNKAKYGLSLAWYSLRKFLRGTRGRWVPADKTDRKSVLEASPSIAKVYGSTA